MNKKGILPLAGLGAGALAVIGAFIFLIVLSVLIFTSINIWAVVGGALIVLTLIYGLRGQGSQGKYIFMGAMVFFGVILVFASGTLQTAVGFSPEKIYVSESGTLYCEEDSLERVTKYADQNYKFTCGKGYLVEECLVYLTCEGTPWYNSGCGGAGLLSLLTPTAQYSSLDEGRKSAFYTKLDVGESLTLTDEVRNAEYLKINYEFRPFNLWSEEFGKDVRLSNTCCLANQEILERDQFEYGDWDCLNPNDKRNYFLGWTEVYGAKTYGDKICLSNTLYNLEKIRLADGSNVNVQGDRIRYVECCPHVDDNCDPDTFTFTKLGEEEEISCRYDYQCPNQGDPDSISEDKAIQYECVDSVCRKNLINIECETDSRCRQLYGTEWVCDKTFDNFGQCIQVAEEENLEDELGCNWYEEGFTRVDKDYGTLYWRAWTPFINPIETEVEGCRTAIWVYLTIGAIVIISLGSVAIIVSRPRRRKRK